MNYKKTSELPEICIKGPMCEGAGIKKAHNHRILILHTQKTGILKVVAFDEMLAI